jgi:hypothetical protein
MREGGASLGGGALYGPHLTSPTVAPRRQGLIKASPSCIGIRPLRFWLLWWLGIHTSFSMKKRHPRL